jgi:beta-lactamase class C
MKKNITLALLISVFIAFLLLVPMQRHISSATGKVKAPGSDSASVINIPKEPLEIEKIINEYDQLLDYEISSSGTVGAAVVIVYKNQIAFLKCYGVKRVGENDPVDENTVFRLASVSKTITGMLAGILDNQKIIRLDDKVINYLPGIKLKDSDNTKKLKIRNLLSHTTGLIPHAYDNMVEEKVPLGKIMEVLNQANISSEPGILYSYQNVMFSLVDTIISIKTFKNYAELVKEKIFMPCGMKNASADFRSFKENTNKAYPHIKINNNRYKAIQLNDRYYSTAPAAGVNASISDMANFLIALLKKNDRIITNKVCHSVFSPQVITHLPGGYFSQWDRTESVHYGIGWRLVGYKGRKIAYHGGYVQGYKTEIALCRDEDIGIAFLSNSPNKTASKSVPLFLNLYFRFMDDKTKIVSVSKATASKELS